MKIEAKQLFGKMVDYHSYAIVLLAVGVFFYLGIIIPNVASTTISQIAGLCGSILFLVSSIFFFIQSKKLRNKLEESDEGKEYLCKK